jgi:hypothetical protein
MVPDVCLCFKDDLRGGSECDGRHGLEIGTVVVDIERTEVDNEVSVSLRSGRREEEIEEGGDEYNTGEPSPSSRGGACMLTGGYGKLAWSP